VSPVRKPSLKTNAAWAVGKVSKAWWGGRSIGGSAQGMTEGTAAGGLVR
jgi:hypothetical protein